MTLAALLSLLVASGGDARFLVSLAGVPSASLEVSVSDQVYRYRAVHLLEEGEVRFERAWPLTDGGVQGLVPEVVALLTPPAEGCQQVFEERRGASETLCVQRRDAGRVDGTLDGVAFTARYQAGRLTAVQVGPMQFQRVEAPGGLSSPAPSPFREGFPVDGARGTPRLEPRVPGLALVSPRTWQGRTSSSRLRCLEAARRAVEVDPSLALVLGLVLEGGRAFPHAWVRRGTDALDPTLGPEDAAALARRAYLALPREAAGLVYLSLLDGRRRVVLR